MFWAVDTFMKPSNKTKSDKASATSKSVYGGGPPPAVPPGGPPSPLGGRSARIPLLDGYGSNGLATSAKGFPVPVASQ